MRARIVGVQAEKLASPSELAVRMPEVADVDDAGASMLDNQFSTEAEVQTNSHVGLLEQEMQKFIDQKLKGSDGGEEQVAQKKSRTDELYDVPEHLQVPCLLSRMCNLPKRHATRTRARAREHTHTHSIQ